MLLEERQLEVAQRIGLGARVVEGTEVPPVDLLELLRTVREGQGCLLHLWPATTRAGTSTCGRQSWTRNGTPTSGSACVQVLVHPLPWRPPYSKNQRKACGDGDMQSSPPMGSTIGAGPCPTSAGGSSSRSTTSRIAANPSADGGSSGTAGPKVGL